MAGNRNNRRKSTLKDQIESLEQKVDSLVRLACRLTDEKITDLSITEKEMLTFREATEYLGISPSLLYKLTSRALIPHYKPRGKMVYFSRMELEGYMKKGKIKLAISLLETNDYEEKKEEKP